MWINVEWCASDFCTVYSKSLSCSVAHIAKVHLDISARVGFVNCLSCKVKISFSQLASHPSCCSSVTFSCWLVRTGVSTAGQVCRAVDSGAPPMLVNCSTECWFCEFTYVDPVVGSCCSPWLCTLTRCGTGYRPPSCWAQPQLICFHGEPGACFLPFYQQDYTISWTTGCTASTRVRCSSFLRTIQELRLVTFSCYINSMHVLLFYLYR